MAITDGAPDGGAEVRATSDPGPLWPTTFVMAGVAGTGRAIGAGPEFWLVAGERRPSMALILLFMDDICARNKLTLLSKMPVRLSANIRRDKSSNSDRETKV